MSLLSPEQLDARRNNALHSTGPQTEEGKAASSRNALKHGFYGRRIVLADEDPEEFAALHRSLVEAHQPVGAQEEMLVLQIATDWWKINRNDRFQHALHAHSLWRLKEEKKTDDPSPHQIVARKMFRCMEEMRDLQNFEDRFNRSICRSLRELRILRKERLQPSRARQQAVTAETITSPVEPPAPATGSAANGAGKQAQNPNFANEANLPETKGVHQVNPDPRAPNPQPPTPNPQP